MIDRVRKIDLESLTEEQYEQVEGTLKKKVKERIDQAILDLNKYLNIYGLEALLAVQIVKEGEANLIKEEVKTNRS